MLILMLGKTNNITSMSARDALKLASSWKHYVTEKIGLLGDEGVPLPLREDVFNNPAPNITIGSIDGLARGLNCSETLMRGAFFTVITDMKVLSTILLRLFINILIMILLSDTIH